MQQARRSGRIAKEVAILLLGTDTRGMVFSEQTKTVVLSRHGAGIVSRHKFAPDEVLTLRIPDSNKEAEIRLVGQIGGEPDRYVYGVAFSDPKLDFWQIEFPAPDANLPDSRRLALECSLCHERQEVQPRDIEADVYSVNQSILRYCANCEASTLWKQAEGDVAASMKTPKRPLGFPATVVPASDPVQTSSTTVAAVLQNPEPVMAPVAVPRTPPAPEPMQATPGHRVNRRRDVRTRVSFTACVRHGISGDDIVECENVSKGGLCFRSWRQYDKDSLIEVAVPYSPGSHAIFVPAQIKHVQEVPGGKLLRYGVAYAKSSSAHQNF